MMRKLRENYIFLFRVLTLPYLVVLINLFLHHNYDLRKLIKTSFDVGDLCKMVIYNEPAS